MHVYHPDSHCLSATNSYFLWIQSDVFKLLVLSEQIPKYSQFTIKQEKSKSSESSYLKSLNYTFCAWLPTLANPLLELVESLSKLWPVDSLPTKCWINPFWQSMLDEPNGSHFNSRSRQIHMIPFLLFCRSSSMISGFDFCPARCSSWSKMLFGSWHTDVELQTSSQVHQ